MTAAGGPLSGTTCLVFAGLGPLPYAAMLLADLGCAVTIVDRIVPVPVSMPPDVDPRRRGQRSVSVDLTQESGRELAEALIRGADVVMEGMRPGVMERLGLAPERCAELNPAAVIVRVTGWGQTGPYADAAGHDINYVGLTGALFAMGEPDKPPPVPLNLIGDYGGGGAFAALGVLAALVERQRSGLGQIVDCSIFDGVLSLCTAMIGMRNAGLWAGRGQNAFDGSRPWYRTYETADGRYLAVGAIEPKFFRALLSGLGLDSADWPREAPADVERLSARLEEIFRRCDRDHWVRLFDGTDACVTPVLSFDEVPGHPHALARGSFVTTAAGTQPAPSPRFSRTPGPVGDDPPRPGRDTDIVLAELGLTPEQISTLRSDEVVQ
jgi:alpha-methylacyl-CoA racemase